MHRTGSPLESLRAPAISFVAGGLLGALAFLAVFGVTLADPTNEGWALVGDHGAQNVGWYFFRHSAWHFPPTRIDSYLFPVGTTVVQTDSLPWIALAAKVASPLLPEPFQYRGLWLLACVILQGAFGFRLLTLGGAAPLGAALGAWLLSLSPALVGEFAETSLCAHWIFLYYGIVWLGWLREESPSSWRIPFWEGLALNVLLVGIHFYLLVSSLALLSALYLAKARFESATGKWRCARLLFGTYAAVILAAGLLGYFSIREPRGVNFGYHHTDLLAFLNPGKTSRFLPSLVDPGIEGYAYLGLGILGLLAASAYARRRHAGKVPATATAPRRFLWSVVLGVIILQAIFALSGQIRVAGRVVLGLGRLYHLIEPLPSMLRCTPRFVWPLYYFCFATALIAPFRLFSQRKATILLALAVALQWVELGPWYLHGLDGYRALKSPRFEPLGFEHELSTLYLVPAFLTDSAEECNVFRGFDYQQMYRFAAFAARHRMNFASGYVARPPTAMLRELCLGLERTWRSGRLEADGLYLVHGNLRDDFLRAVGDKAECRAWEGITACRKRRFESHP